MTRGQNQKYDPTKHQRKFLRLREYDYSQAGAYFITIITYQRACLFGEIVDGAMELNEYSHIADECWRAISDHFPHVELGGHVVMPNHIHGIGVIHKPVVGATHASPLRDQSKARGHILDHWGPLLDRSNPRSPAAFAGNTMLMPPGSAIITNTSCATMTICTVSSITSPPTPPQLGRG